MPTTRTDWQYVEHLTAEGARGVALVRAGEHRKALELADGLRPVIVRLERLAAYVECATAVKARERILAACHS